MVMYEVCLMKPCNSRENRCKLSRGKLLMQLHFHCTGHFLIVFIRGKGRGEGQLLLYN